MKKGDRIDGTWVVDGALGHGGMGSVYRCHHVKSERIEAAIKVLADSLRQDQEAVSRFVREAEILHRLDHPAVVKVRSVRVDADPPYLEMEFVNGTDLADVLEDGALPMAEALDVSRQLFAALEYLHDNEVRHRDLKPENVLIREETGKLVLVDFGLALDAGVSRLTQANMAFGTVAYAPPEWLKPDQIDPCAWDLYAAGVLTWELLTGEVPFPYSGEGPLRQQALQVMLGKQDAPPLDPGEECPPSLRQLVGDLTHASPTARPQTAGEVIARLDAVIALIESGWQPGEPDISAAPPTLPPDLEDTPGPSQRETEVPVPHRTGPVSGPISLPEPEPIGFPGWQVGAVLALLLAAVAGTSWMARRQATNELDLAALHDGSVAVRMETSGLVNPELLAVALDGRLPTRTAGEVFWFDEINPGSQTVEWAYGEGCALNTCPGDACGKWCGFDQAVVEVELGEQGTAEVHLDIPVPRREVSVVLKVLKEPKKGLFKRTAGLRPWGWLAGQEAVADGATAKFTGIPPGEHSLLLAIGTCPEEAAGCTGAGECPDGCSSERRTLTVGWADTPLFFTSDLPLPD